MADHRIIQGGNSLPFTCENKGYKTNINKGVEHNVGDAHKGSVTHDPLYGDRNGYSLWLEYVEEKKTGDSYYWFMWYVNGIPNIPMSGVIDASEINDILQKISAIKIVGS